MERVDDLEYLDEPPTPESEPPERVGWRVPLAVLLVTALCDVTIYRGEGYAGIAALAVLAPLLMCLGQFAPRCRCDVMFLGAMLLLAGARLVWLGNPLLAGSVFILLFAFALTLSGARPFLFDIFTFAVQALIAGIEELARWAKSARCPNCSVTRTGVAGVLLPLAVLIAFGSLFVLANPDLRDTVSQSIEWFTSSFFDWLREHMPPFSEYLFWGGVIWITAGMLRPLSHAVKPYQADDEPDALVADERGLALFAPYRNTLAAVIVLFAFYLVFEFETLWFREFPEGFHYSGYAHEGAFWLTVALALATVVLSLIFRGGVLAHPQQPMLRRLAWIWSAQNLLLAVTVYHRLMIYVGFNGMTRMRVVGFFGMTAVVVGLLLVIYKIAKSRSFVWLVQRQLWTLAITILFYALAPVDAFVTHHNVSRILAGDLAPSVQISQHPLDAEGMLQLPPLLDCENEIIREGVRAILTQQFHHKSRREERGWSAFQWADELLWERLNRESDRMLPPTANYYTPFARFKEFAYRWY